MATKATLVQPASFARRCHPQDDLHKRAVVRLDNFSGSSASGVVIAKNYVITVAHAVDDSADTFVNIDDTWTEGTVLAIDEREDLALLRVETGDIEPIRISRNLPLAGETVWATGFPLAASQRVSTGFFKSLDGSRLYASVHINSGASGGGLLRCENGQVSLAGVVHGFVALRRGGDLINIGDSLSVSAETIRSFIRQAGPRTLQI